MTTYQHDRVLPYDDSGLSKTQQVASMFDDIAGRYDFLNRFLSGGVDLWWRKKAISQLRGPEAIGSCVIGSGAGQILDVATGTGDMALMTFKRLHPQKVTGIDISEGMLALGKQKVNHEGLAAQIELKSGDSQAIPFEDNSFDAVTVAFGVRNFERLEKGLEEIKRVLKPGGKLVVLEFSRPKGAFGHLYQWYMGRVTPFICTLLSRNKQAYTYLGKSIQAFPEGADFTAVLQKTGYRQPNAKALTMGICSIYTGIK
jgi:demethylmenaquinone methyltransferase/2-methoxy-6-polyprenyl-1,4-benzoquinol methylase